MILVISGMRHPYETMQLCEASGGRVLTSTLLEPDMLLKHDIILLNFYSCVMMTHKSWPVQPQLEQHHNNFTIHDGKEGKPSQNMPLTCFTSTLRTIVDITMI